MTENVKMREPLPKWFAEIFKIAQDANLTFPRGRALYLVNRLQNGDGYFSPESGWWGSMEYNGCPTLDRLKRVREKTAQDWFEHWQSGGHIRVIGMTNEEHQMKRRAADKDRRKRRKEIDAKNEMFRNAKKSQVVGDAQGNSWKEGDPEV